MTLGDISPTMTVGELKTYIYESAIENNNRGEVAVSNVSNTLDALNSRQVPPDWKRLIYMGQILANPVDKLVDGIGMKVGVLLLSGLGESTFPTHTLIAKFSPSDIVSVSFLFSLFISHNLLILAPRKPMTLTIQVKTKNSIHLVPILEGKKVKKKMSDFWRGGENKDNHPHIDR